MSTRANIRGRETLSAPAPAEPEPRLLAPAPFFIRVVPPDGLSFLPGQLCSTRQEAEVPLASPAVQRAEGLGYRNAIVSAGEVSDHEVIDSLIVVRGRARWKFLGYWRMRSRQIPGDQTLPPAEEKEGVLERPGRTEG